MLEPLADARSIILGSMRCSLRYAGDHSGHCLRCSDLGGRKKHVIDIDPVKGGLVTRMTYGTYPFPARLGVVSLISGNPQ